MIIRLPFMKFPLKKELIKGHITSRQNPWSRKKEPETRDVRILAVRDFPLAQPVQVLPLFV